MNSGQKNSKKKTRIVAISRKESHENVTTSSLNPAIAVKITVKQAIEMASKIQKKSCLSWYDKLDPQKKKWCDELRKEFNSGSCDHVTVESIRAVLNDNLSLTVRAQPFRLWLKSIARSKG